jgi:hypothetical protein
MRRKWWQECSDLNQMLDHLEVFHHVHRTKTGKRKIRLLACACVRLVWGLASKEEDHRAIEVAEQYADGLVRKPTLAAAMGTTEKLVDRLWWAGKLGRPVIPQGGTFRAVFGTFTSTTESEEERRAKCGLIRDLFSNVFMPVKIAPGALTWNDGIVPKLAQAIYADRAFDRMPILADALEEAGCDNADILGHLRGEGPHVRGCWVLDLLLAKE